MLWRVIQFALLVYVAILIIALESTCYQNLEFRRSLSRVLLTYKVVKFPNALIIYLPILEYGLYLPDEIYRFDV